MSDRTPEERREELVELYREVCAGCCCGLGATRTKPVFGMGNANADLMFVGEAPGAEEDRQGKPFVGRAGKLLDQLLGEVGLERNRDTFIANTLKCLRYTAQVQLEDGSWERIGRLVRRRYSGKVMSVDSGGRLVPRRVIGWHATPLAGRRVFHMTFKSAKPNGRHRAGIELTGDHPVLTERGYVAVQDLTPGDRIAVGQGMSTLERDVIPRISEHDTAAVTAGPRSYGAVHVRTLRQLQLGVAATRELSERIASFVHPTMRHKLHPEVERRIAFDPGAFEQSAPLTMYDEVEVEEVTDRPRGDTTFFCIDVEETHNFVTSGGVVHNCRPPGNRDPQPDEIAACRPYLQRQIELIEPLVICTLGNFATKLLSGSQVGITRCCGRPQERVVAGRPVVLYPLFHPAAALRTPTVLEQLRSDFSRIPELLERERERARARERPSALAAMAASIGASSEPEPEPPPQLGLFGSS